MGMSYDLKEFHAGHPLVEFVIDAFGLPIASLLLAGYGREHPEQEERFEFTVKREGGDKTWKVWVEGRTLPFGNEPLVLAALLKFLLLRIKLDHMYVSYGLEFSMGELLREVRQDVIEMTEEEVERIIVKYTKVSYRTEVWDERRAQKHKKPVPRSESRLVFGYESPVYEDDWGGIPRRLFYRASLSIDLVQGLKNRVFTFAGMKLGPVNPVQ
jgi:hypothetical protein